MMDPDKRPTATDLLVAPLFSQDNFNVVFNQVRE
jgi:hypothetical protein